MPLFYLGTHLPSWLSKPEVDVPLFVSHRRLKVRKRLPRATSRWALDSGGFTELSIHGKWVTTPTEYLDATHRYAAEVGRLDWAAPMDWMCEPFMLRKTGLSIDRHQGLTVENVSLLRAHTTDVWFVPVLQGWTVADYMACAERYAAAGIDVTTEPLVGIGSVCRRQSTFEIAAIVGELARAGIACHGFGVKTDGVARYGRHLASCDSLAWSYNARCHPPLDGCEHVSCSNCLKWALRWRENLLQRLGVQQPQLWGEPTELLSDEDIIAATMGGRLTDPKGPRGLGSGFG